MSQQLDRTRASSSSGATSTQPSPRRASRWGLDAPRGCSDAWPHGANFFLAEVVAVILPFLSDYLHEQGWRYDAVGLATAAGGLGVLVAQTPAGVWVDRARRPREWLLATALLLGVCYGAVPLLPASVPGICALLFAAGVTQAFFLPLLGALALALAGHAGINRLMGTNQVFNHLGNLASAGLALVLVQTYGVRSVFFATLAASVGAAACCLAIRAEDVHPVTSSPEGRPVGPPGQAGARPVKPSSEAEPAGSPGPAGWRQLLSDRRVQILLVCIALFHLSNAPVMPLVAMYLGQLGGSKAQIAGVVLVAQVVMVGTSWPAGLLGDRLGRKPLLAAGFVVLPVRIALYAVAPSPEWLLAIQVLDGVGAGVYGMVVVSMCADLCTDKANFNTLVGMTATALALGGVIGPLVSGAIVQQLGFQLAFAALAAVAAVGAGIFIAFMPETRTVT